MDDGEKDRRKTRSMAELDWVGRVMGGIEGMVRTMEENKKRAESHRRGLEARLKVVEGNMMDLGRMLKLGVNLIKADQYELRKAIERDNEGTKMDNEVTEEESEDEEVKGDEDDKGTKEDREDEEKDEKDKEDKDEEMVDETKNDGEDKAEVMAEVMAETVGGGGRGNK